MADTAVEQGAEGRAGRFLGTVATRFAAVGLGAVTGVVLARALGPEGRGEYAVAVAVASTTASLAHLSIEQANVYLWHRGEQKRELASNAMVLAATVGTGAAVVAGVIAWNILDSVDDVALLIVLAAVPMNLGALYFNNLTVLDNRIGRVNLGTLAAAVVQTAGVVALAVLGDLDVREAALLWAVAAALPIAVVAGGFGARLRYVSGRLARQALGTGLQYHLGMAALFLLWRVDVFLLNGLSTQAQVGLYAVAVSVGELLYVVTNATAEVVLPGQVGGSDRAAADFTARVFRVNAVVAVVVAVGVVALAPLVVPAVFGSDFGDSVGPLAALMPGVAALGIIRPVTAFLVRLDRPLVVSGLVWTAFTMNVVLNLVLIPSLDAVGAALASSAAYAALAAAYLRWFARAASLRGGDLRPRTSELRELATKLWARSAPGG